MCVSLLSVNCLACYVRLILRWDLMTGGNSKCRYIIFHVVLIGIFNCDHILKEYISVKNRNVILCRMLTRRVIWAVHIECVIHAVMITLRRGSNRKNIQSWMKFWKLSNGGSYTFLFVGNNSALILLWWHLSKRDMFPLCEFTNCNLAHFNVLTYFN